MNYPLQLSFKILAMAPQVTLTDATGAPIFYVRQKIFRLREGVQVYASKAEREQGQPPIFTVESNRIIDFSATYRFTDEEGRELGSVRRRGMRSLFKAHYEVHDGGHKLADIKEEKALTRLLDGLFEQIPVLGGFSGYLFHPAFRMTDASGQLLLRMAKQADFFEGKFAIEKHAELEPVDEYRALLALLMMVLLERERG